MPHVVNVDDLLPCSSNDGAEPERKRGKWKGTKRTEDTEKRKARREKGPQSRSDMGPSEVLIRHWSKAIRVWNNRKPCRGFLLEFIANSYHLNAN